MATILMGRFRESNRVIWYICSGVASLALSISGLVIARGYFQSRSGERPIPGFHARFFLGAYTPLWSDMPYKYFLYLPREVESAEHLWPLIVFLPGHGERYGELGVGLSQAIRERLENAKPCDFMALFPSAPEANWEPGSDNERQTMELLDDVMRRYPVDPHRIYLTGHSAGGRGVWQLASAYPDRWAAIVPLYGGGRPDIERVKHIPCWIHQGDRDPIVNVPGIRDLVRRLRAAGAPVRYTEYPTAEHVIWQKVYKNDEFFTWLAGQRKP